MTFEHACGVVTRARQALAEAGSVSEHRQALVCCADALLEMAIRAYYPREYAQTASDIAAHLAPTTAGESSLPRRCTDTILRAATEVLAHAEMFDAIYPLTILPFDLGALADVKKKTLANFVHSGLQIHGASTDDRVCQSMVVIASRFLDSPRVRHIASDLTYNSAWRLVQRWRLRTISVVPGLFSDPRVYYARAIRGVLARTESALGDSFRAETSQSTWWTADRVAAVWTAVAMLRRVSLTDPLTRVEAALGEVLVSMLGSASIPLLEDRPRALLQRAVGVLGLVEPRTVARMPILAINPSAGFTYWRIAYAVVDSAPVWGPWPLAFPFYDRDSDVVRAIAPRTMATYEAGDRVTWRLAAAEAASGWVVRMPAFAISSCSVRADSDSEKTEEHTPPSKHIAAVAPST